jgi:peptidoglycan/xylan/chitin deacetylase (PgdA/CDA1 family)
MAEKLTPMMQQYFEVKRQICSPVFSGLFAGIRPERIGNFPVRLRSPSNAELGPGGYNEVGIKIRRSQMTCRLHRPWAAALVALATCTGAFAENPVPSAHIARFAGDRPAAISYTFDDNLRDQYTLAVPMLNEVGFKGTFFVIAGKTAETPEEGEQKKANGNVRNLWGGISWPELKKLAEQGHEIASHTWTHSGLTKLTPADLDAQLRLAYDAIKARIGKPPLTLAFPGNGSNPEVQASALKYHVAYRAYQESTKAESTTVSLNAWADQLVRERQLGILMIHGISQGYAALSDPGILLAHLKYVKSRERDIWVDTFANVSRYGKERDNAQLTVAGGAKRVSCVLSSTLDPQLYDVPLTIVVQVADVISASATRAGQELPVRVGSDAIYVEAAPSMQPIIITWR